ncbi:MAG TPA: PfkB family carbohydrate kinase, partial [Devosia sp.]
MFVVGGESLIDLISEPVGPDGTIKLVAHQGGSPYNCAIALSKLGNDTGFLCPISSDGLGTYLLGPLAEAGVRPLLGERVAAYTTLAVVTFDDKKSAQYGFYRQADRAFTREGLIAALP